MNDREHDEMLTAVHEHDVRMRLAFIDAYEKDHRDWHIVEAEISEKFRGEYLAILEKYNGSAVYRSPYPSNHVPR